MEYAELAGFYGFLGAFYFVFAIVLAYVVFKVKSILARVFYSICSVSLICYAIYFVYKAFAVSR